MTQWTSTANSNTQTGTLTWNANGTLQDMQINDTADATNVQNCTYSYDDVERLLSANCGSVWSQTFGYDAFGNIAKTGSSSFHPGYTSGNHVIGFTYDSMGNVTNDGAYTYTYDAEGRPITVGGVQITYDALGRAVEQNRSGSYTQILYSPMGQKFGLMNGSAVKQYFVPLAGGVQAVYNSSGLQYYRHSDWLGSSRFAATTSGTVYYDGAYAPFGENYAETGTTDRSFTGQTQDTVSGLYDLLLRQQSSAQGRWLVPDPAGLTAVDLTNPQTWNRYGYVGNNPLADSDQFGLATCPPGSESTCVDVTAQAPSDVPTDWVLTPGCIQVFGSAAVGCDYGGSRSIPGGFTFRVNVTEKLPSSTNIPLVQPLVFGPVTIFVPRLPYIDPFDPQHRLFNTHYCGPGGGGDDLNSRDVLCHHRDDCFTDAGIDANAYRGGDLPSDKISAAAACNQKLCDGLLSLNAVNSDASLFDRLSNVAILLYFATQGQAQCHIR